ncbi:hypothetical protein G9A89_015105 [Geosiphon pyriformis]|nr:hypothetical protein G9A89_015105 [Geosiphon pyriformis]
MADTITSEISIPIDVELQDGWEEEEEQEQEETEEEIEASDEEQEEEDDEEGRGLNSLRWTYLFGWGQHQRDRTEAQEQRHPDPDPRGDLLLKTGEFGHVERYEAPGSIGNLPSSKNIIDKLRFRETFPRRISPDFVGKHFRPNSHGQIVAHYPAPAYCGQYSEDGSFFYTCCRDFRIYTYDTSDPTRFIQKKVIIGEQGRWTITDANLSPDNQLIAYTSITPYVFIARTQENGFQTKLDFSNQRGDDFGLWSIRFSNDGRELVAGSNKKSIYVCNIERNKVTLKLSGHSDDVNAVCFADESSNILYSGSDDSIIKVWDRRSMHGKKASGVLIGHREGITYVASKGDGRYCLSNSKDQSMKLWDIRKMMSSDKFDGLPHREKDQRRDDWDYRMHRYPGNKYGVHPHDVSVMTYRGHKVLKTLIRCHFSPRHTTGQRYLYSGSEDGYAHIYSLDGTIVEKLDAQSAMDRHAETRRLRRNHSIVTRDVNWHPYAPIITSTNWLDSVGSSGAVISHTYREISEQNGL